MDELLIRRVRRRAGSRCDYCRLPEALSAGPFEVEHVIAKQHGGPTSLANLAYACLRCNKHKGPNLAGIDRRTSRTKLVRIFNPRRHKWSAHFRWAGPLIVGRTAIGRVTLQLLSMNDSLRVA